MSVKEGTQVGSYRMLSRIGEGGMGEVWLAEHVALGRRAAIKLLRAEMSTREEVVERFFNEARAASSIADPGIVQIFDFGRDAGGAAYIVMELLDGESLHARLMRLRRLDVPDAVRIIRQAASSLEAAHARGIVHRDLKPENVFLSRDPEMVAGERAKILDFGIAKLLGDATSRVATQASAVMGTPTYMSPEQCRGAGGVDHRSDIYSLGCVLFLLLTGRTPFISEGMGELLMMHMMEPAPAPSQFAPHVPAGLDAIVLRCLEKDRDKRYASAAELAQALSGVVEAGTIYASATPVGAAAGKSTVTTLSSSIAAMERQEQASRSHAPFLAIAGACLVIIGGAFVIARAHRGHVEPRTPSIAPSPAPVPLTAQRADVPDASDAPPEPPRDPSEGIAAVLEAAVRWTSAHEGCPTLDQLGVPQADAWGTPIQIRCTRQQVLVSVAGPDRAFATPDDITSSSPRPVKTSTPKKLEPPKTKPPVATPPVKAIDCFEHRC